MNRTEFNEFVAKECNIEKIKAKKMVDNVLNCILKGMEAKEDINLTGFGKFEMNKVDEKICRNPSTGEKVVVPEHFSPKFKFASNIKNILK